MNKSKTDWWLVFWVLVFTGLFLHAFIKWWYCL